ncbi:type II toxin-antitoxin system tRNA(fMet)-specific endonuclease VapC [Spartinivicinus poritis]|uniref:Type II toxin-antitoxin system VapC family toxin n=1 Tax=Spartinivicinus poritis TaxID=2994640 RepID=A0ABT5UGH9_9GAMM|nr:type II toxin-antitoxin system VapC family toxin [Spartinivicinus sp. A2-2]MDE1465422.1 type II toxin-antitoxin system VapC family toxin [Spartinivicinus sp. A2-2]
MKYMLDTNICIYLMKKHPKEVVARFADCYYGDVVISSITLGELEYGVEVSAEKEKNAQALKLLLEDIPVMPFEDKAAQSYGVLRAGAPKRKGDALDKLIAAHAKSLEVVLVTNNVKDFQKYPGITIENWVNNH